MTKDRRIWPKGLRHRIRKYQFTITHNRVRHITLAQWKQALEDCDRVVTVYVGPGGTEWEKRG